MTIWQDKTWVLVREKTGYWLMKRNTCFTDNPIKFNGSVYYDRPHAIPPYVKRILNRRMEETA